MRPAFLKEKWAYALVPPPLFVFLILLAKGAFPYLPHNILADWFFSGMLAGAWFIFIGAQWEIHKLKTKQVPFGVSKS